MDVAIARPIARRILISPSSPSDFLKATTRISDAKHTNARVGIRVNHALPTMRWLELRRECIDFLMVDVGTPGCHRRVRAMGGRWITAERFARECRDMGFPVVAHTPLSDGNVCADVFPAVRALVPVTWAITGDPVLMSLFVHQHGRSAEDAGIPILLERSADDITCSSALKGLIRPFETPLSTMVSSF